MSTILGNNLDEKAPSKSAKRRAKKKHLETSHKESVTLTLSENDPKDVLLSLRKQIEKAKLEQNHAAVGALRQRIWLLQDASAGVKSNVSGDQLQKILLESTNQAETEQATSNKCGPPPTLDECRMEVLEKQKKKLVKKKNEITKLKVRVGKGEHLEKTQKLKIEREMLIDDEIDNCEEEIFQLKQLFKSERE